MDENKSHKLIGSAKDVTNTVVIAYVAVIAVKGLAELTKDWWNYKTHSTIGA